jgi:2-methylcitrate dehydratase
VQVWFKDGSSTPKAEAEYPLGHQRRRAEAMPALRAKFETSLQRRFPPHRCQQILKTCYDGPAPRPHARWTDSSGMFAAAEP